MSRPKGSKNKTAVTKETLEAVVTPPVIKTVHSCVNCGHDNALHYGSPDKWCNQSGCQCLKFQ